MTNRISYFKKFRSRSSPATPWGKCCFRPQWSYLFIKNAKNTMKTLNSEKTMSTKSQFNSLRCSRWLFTTNRTNHCGMLFYLFVSVCSRAVFVMADWEKIHRDYNKKPPGPNFLMFIWKQLVNNTLSHLHLLNALDSIEQKIFSTLIQMNMSINCGR